MPAVVTFLKVVCHHTSEAGEDEVYLTWEQEQIWPTGKRYEDMNDGWEREINQTRVFSQSGRGQAKLLEYDTPGDIDLLGETYISSAEAQGQARGDTTEWRCTGDGGNYTVTYKVLA